MKKRPKTSSPPMILTESLLLYCREHKIGSRALARETGIIPMNASRFLRGETVSYENFMKILAWTLKPIPTEEASPISGEHNIPPAP